MSGLIELREIGLEVTSPVPTRILHGVNLDVSAGGSLTILGPSGAGKTTLASIIGALQAPTSGSYRFDGKEVLGLSQRQLAAFRARHMGFVFQSSHLIDERTARANVEMGIVDNASDAAERAARAEDALELVGLGYVARRRAAHLSGGERHRVALARALVKGPSVVIADEPTAALDQATGQGILDLLATVPERGATLIVVSHDHRAAQMADRVVTVIDGTITDVSGSHSAVLDGVSAT
jgi:ABC-type lipoprotein export system ATPase subunit